MSTVEITAYFESKFTVRYPDCKDHSEACRRVKSDLRAFGLHGLTLLSSTSTITENENHLDTRPTLGQFNNLGDYTDALEKYTDMLEEKGYDGKNE